MLDCISNVLLNNRNIMLRNNLSPVLFLKDSHTQAYALQVHTSLTSLFASTNVRLGSRR